jgi:hypothetical protein
VFVDEGLNIHEVVTTRVPRLLPEATIKALRLRARAVATYLHGDPKHDYLLSGRVFCGSCGSTLSGQATTTGGRLYLFYGHAHIGKAAECPVRPRPQVRADVIETEVAKELFKMFGNPAAIERAVGAAIPDRDRAAKRKALLEAELAKLQRGRDAILDLITRNKLTLSQAERKLGDIVQAEGRLGDELDGLAETLAAVPTAESLRGFVEEIGDALGTSIVVYDEAGEQMLGGNDLDTWLSMDVADRRALLNSFFGGPMPDGTAPGVYLTPAGGDYYGPKTFSYELRGRLAWVVRRRAVSSPAVPPYYASSPPFSLSGRLTMTPETDRRGARVVRP